MVYSISAIVPFIVDRVVTLECFARRLNVVVHRCFCMIVLTVHRFCLWLVVRLVFWKGLFRKGLPSMLVNWLFHKLISRHMARFARRLGFLNKFVRLVDRSLDRLVHFTLFPTLLCRFGI